MILEKNINEIRENFPHLEFIVHLGAAGSSPLCLKWFNAIQTFWSHVRTGSTLGGTFSPRPGTISEKAKKEAAKLLNAAEKEICWIQRVNQGLQLVKDIIEYNDPWRKGDNVVFTDQGYPSSGHTWLSLKEKDVELRQVKNVDGVIQLSDLEQAIDENTKLVCINRTTWHLGFTHNVKAVCQLAHEKEALVVDDAYQAVGALDINVKNDDIDFLVTGSHKWQCGPDGAGIFYIREDLIEKFKTPRASYPNTRRPKGTPGFTHPDHDNLTSYDYPYVETALKMCVRTTALSILWGWHATLQYLNELGPENIQKRNRKLAEYLVERVQDIGCRINTPIQDKTTLENLHLLNYTTGSYDHDKKSCESLGNHIPVSIKGPMLRFQGGVGGIRICTHFFNTEDDIETFINIQRKFMPK